MAFRMPVSALYSVSFVDTDQWTSPNYHMKGLSRYNSMLIGRTNQAKFENDCVSKNGHKIKITQSNSMILVSFSSAENALFNDVKKYDTFSLQSTKNQPFHFFGTPSILFNQQCPQGPRCTTFDLSAMWSQAARGRTSVFSCSVEIRK